jgi:hypothetical protein
VLTVVELMRRMPWLAVGWFWFVGVPVIALVQKRAQAMANRNAYIPQFDF